MSKTTLIDFPILNDGYTPDDRDEYTQQLEALAARHGILPAGRYDTLQHLSGSLQGAIGVNLWEMDAPGALDALLSDVEYRANVEWRDQLHDMERLTMYLASSVLDEGPPDPEKPALLDLVVLNPGMTLEDRAEYGKTVAQIAAEYGARVRRSFRIDRHVRGDLPEAVEFNIWELPDPGVFEKILSHPDYQANIGERDRIHDMGRLTMILAKPRI
ncbi:MAG: hypothetical protein ACC726_14655 [Chloroflexota bacterium]